MEVFILHQGGRGGRKDRDSVFSLGRGGGGAGGGKGASALCGYAVCVAGEEGWGECPCATSKQRQATAVEGDWLQACSPSELSE